MCFEADGRPNSTSLALCASLAEKRSKIGATISREVTLENLLASKSCMLETKATKLKITCACILCYLFWTGSFSFLEHFLGHHLAARFSFRSIFEF